MGSTKHLGEVVSINRSIMLLVADAERASKRQGTSNGPVEFEPEGSDSEKALQALHPSTDEEREATKAGATDGPDGRLFVTVRGVDTELVPSGKLACFPAPSRGAPFADLARDDGEHADMQANEVVLDDESGVLVHVAAGTYDVVHESMAARGATQRVPYCHCPRSESASKRREWSSVLFA